ncbi:hypothetical protein [Bacillus mycoides]|uniref:hypothetical protein n=1 Tax=Bacillus mycoides TaxID=1405 RepID=UPI0037FA8AA1
MEFKKQIMKDPFEKEIEFLNILREFEKDIEKQKKNFEKDENFIVVKNSGIFDNLAKMDWENKENVRKLLEATGSHSTCLISEISVPKLLKNFNIDPQIIEKYKKINNFYAKHELVKKLWWSITFFAYKNEEDNKVEYIKCSNIFTSREFKYYKTY